MYRILRLIGIITVMSAGLATAAILVARVRASRRSGGPWYTSSHPTAQYYYCAEDTWGWQDLSPELLLSYPTEDALLAAWEGQRVKHPDSAR